MQSILNTVRYIPTLPVILAQVLALLNNEDASAKDLEEIITNDQALCSKVLAVANSAYYGFRHKILTVNRAVVALGHEEIRNICLGASLIGFLNPANLKDPETAEQLWLHSVAVADASYLVAKHCGALRPDAAFTAGLLHDLGKVALMAFLPKSFEEITGLMASQGLGYRQAEKATDLDHAIIGRDLGQRWELPLLLVDAIGYHHDMHAGVDHYHAAAAVHVADCLVRRAQLGDSLNSDPPEIKSRPQARLGLTEADVAALSLKLEARSEAIVHLWSTLMDKPSP